jgi:hypothetical protein
MNIDIIDIYGDWYDCECCGSYTASGICIKINNVTVWQSYSDGHLDGYTTQYTILDAILGYYLNEQYLAFREETSENKRIQWNTTHPGNHIASSPITWIDYHKQRFQHTIDQIQHVRDMCVNLPYRESLQVKMICLWLQDNLEVDITIRETTIHENNIDPYPEDIVFKTDYTF